MTADTAGLENEENIGGEAVLTSELAGTPNENAGWAFGVGKADCAGAGELSCLAADALGEEMAGLAENTEEPVVAVLLDVAGTEAADGGTPNENEAAGASDLFSPNLNPVELLTLDFSLSVVSLVSFGMPKENAGAEDPPSLDAGIPKLNLGASEELV